MNVLEKDEETMTFFNEKLIMTSSAQTIFTPDNRQTEQIYRHHHTGHTYRKEYYGNR